MILTSRRFDFKFRCFTSAFLVFFVAGTGSGDDFPEG